MTATATPPMVRQEPTDVQPTAGAHPLRAARSSALALLALVVVTGAVCVAFWPGHMDLDTTDEYYQAQSGHYNDYHTPTLSFLWRGIYLLGLHSPGWVLAGSVFSLLLGIYLLLRVRMSRPTAVVAAALVFAFPPVLGWAVQVGRDAWFTAFLLLGFGLVARASRSTGRLRVALLAGVVVVAFLTDAARQNALPATIVMLGAATVVLLDRHRTPRWRGAVAAGAGVVVGVALFAAQIGVVYGALHADGLHPEQNVYIYDLASMSRQENTVLFPRDVYPIQSIAYLKFWSNPLDPDALIYGPHAVIDTPLAGPRFDHLAQAWRDAVRTHPRAYLRARASLTIRQLAVNIPANFVYEVPPQPPGWLFTTRFPGLHARVMQYVSVGSTQSGGSVLGGPLQKAWVYVLLLIAACMWLARRRTRDDLLLTLLGVATLLFAAALVVVAPVVMWRYMYPVVVVAVVLVVISGVEIGLALRTRQRRRTTVE